jgi:hypothetical protein
MECAALCSSLNSQPDEGCFTPQVSRTPGSTVEPSHCSLADLAGNHKLRSRSWAVDVESRKRFPSLAQPGVICRPVRPPLRWAAPEAGMVPSWRARPRRCVPAYWLAPRRRHYGECGTLVAPATRSGRKTASCVVARLRVHLYEQCSQVGVPTFADAEQLLLAAGRVFPWDHSHPGCELPTLVEGRPLPMAAMSAVAVTGPIPGIATSR